MKEKQLSAHQQLVLEAEKQVIHWRTKVDLLKKDIKQIKSSFSNVPLQYTQAIEKLGQAERYLKRVAEQETDFYFSEQQVVVEGYNRDLLKYLRLHPGKYKLIKVEE